MGALRLNELDLNAVCTELREFGLNPHEWAFSAELNGAIHFINIDDANFKIGVKIQAVREGQIRVAELSVISL